MGPGREFKSLCDEPEVSFASGHTIGYFAPLTYEQFIYYSFFFLVHIWFSPVPAPLFHFEVNH